jgi:hypothetical protein
MAEQDTLESQDEAPGWLAIDAALQRVYGNVEPAHFGTCISYSLGGPDPLDGISAYKSDEVAPHWHFVSYGLSELYTKESQDSGISGYGFEFTFRLLRADDETEPPMWALNFLQNLARYVFHTGKVFAPGHRIPANGPIAQGQETEIHAATFVEDPQLGTIDTPHGRLQFLQIVGITNNELQFMQQNGSDEVLKLLAEVSPLLITDLNRKSVMGETKSTDSASNPRGPWAKLFKKRS